MNIVYIARRSLITGHVAGNEYTLSIDTTTRTRSRRVEKVQQKTLSGRHETLWFHGERLWNVTFEPIQGSAILALQEFLDSTESGEQFSMTLHGETEDAVTVARTDTGYTFDSHLEIGDLARDWVTASVEVVEQ